MTKRRVRLVQAGGMGGVHDVTDIIKGTMVWEGCGWGGVLSLGIGG